MASVIKVLLLLLLNLGLVWSDYVLLVRSHSYANPSNRCAQCQLGCCDRFFDTICNVSIIFLCDTYLDYCLQSVGSTTICEPQFASATVWNGQPIDFSQTTVLGIPNPLPLSGVSVQWEGVELYIAAIDDDRDSEENLPNDLIDDFLITIPNNVSFLGAAETTPEVFTGRFSLAQIELSFQVICALDFTGDRCEVVIDDCVGTLSNCSGNGQCIDGVRSFTCDCEPGFTGSYCETNINECASVNCTGNGVCVDGIKDFICICDSGYTGGLCQIDINDCINVSCNNGLCQDKVDDFVCDCDSGFEGSFCDVNINECTRMNVNCSGRGTCIDGVNSFICDCEPGYTGHMCESDIDYCIGVNCSGNRHCLDGVNRYDCVCDSEYFGTNCNIHISHLKPIIIAGPVGGFLVLLLLILCLATTIFITFRHCRRKRKKYSPHERMNRTNQEDSIPFIQEDRSRRRETNIYASLTLDGKVVCPTHPDDAVIFYWNENYRAPPLKPTSLKSSVTKQNSDDQEDSMCYNPLYDGSTNESTYSKVADDVNTSKIRPHNSRGYRSGVRKGEYYN